MLSQRKKVNIYTDSKYAFVVVHALGAIWREKGLLTSGNKDVKHAEEILQLLEAVNVPDQVVIMHCPGHHRDGSCVVTLQGQAGSWYLCRWKIFMELLGGLACLYSWMGKLCTLQAACLLVCHIS